MSVNTLTELVPYASNVQVVIDRIAEILVNELANQQALAPGNGGNAADYDIRVFTDRFYPVDQFSTDKRPVINVRLSDQAVLPKVTATHGKRQDTVTIAVYAYAVGTSKETVDGHITADYEASVKVKKIQNVINRILKADINSNLQLPRTVVNSVIIESGQYLMPDFDNRDFEPVIAMRTTVTCNVTEQPVVNNGLPMESIVIDIEKDDTGLVSATLEYDLTEE